MKKSRVNLAESQYINQGNKKPRKPAQGSAASPLVAILPIGQFPVGAAQ